MRYLLFLLKKLKLLVIGYFCSVMIASTVEALDKTGSASLESGVSPMIPFSYADIVQQSADKRVSFEGA